MAFSSNLRYLRKKNNMSQETLANKLGYKSFTTIQKWETGIAEPSVSILQKLANIFNVSMDELLNCDLEDTINNTEAYYLDPEAAQIAQEVFERPQMKVLFDASRKVSVEDLDLVINMLDRMKKAETHEDEE